MFCEQSKVQYLLSARKNTGTPNPVKMVETVRTMDAVLGQPEAIVSLKMHLYFIFII